MKTEEDCNRLQQELSSARRRGASLDADFHSKERTVNQLRTKIAVLEQVSAFMTNFLTCFVPTCVIGLGVFAGIERQGRTISEAAGPLDCSARAKGYLLNEN